jgi:hypothetical protein
MCVEDAKPIVVLSFFGGFAGLERGLPFVLG